MSKRKAVHWKNPRLLFFYPFIDSNLNNLQIPIKIIQTADEATISKIIVATNTQTEVTNEQLMSLNEFHRRLVSFYTTFEGNQRLYYERRSRQYDTVQDIEKVRIVSINTQIKAVAAMFFDKPHLASRYYGKLLKSKEGIFDNNHRLMPYYCCTYALYKLEYMFRNKLLPSEYRKFRYHILMLLKYDIATEKIPQLNANKMDRLCEKIIDCINDNTIFTEEINKLITQIQKIASDSSDSEPTKSANFVTQLKQQYVIK